jgi:hypothetical protein
MAPAKQARNITIVGGTGTVGAPILAALLAEGIHTVSVITRADSTSTFPAGVAATHRGAYDDAAFLTRVLAGQDVLILALSYTAYGAQTDLIAAAAAAGVSLVVPTEFGSDATHAALNSEIQLMNFKTGFRQQIEAEAARGRDMAWLGVTNNPWFDYCMRAGFLGVDLKTRTAELFDGGHVRANFTTLRRVGQSLAAVLSQPDAQLAAYRNGWVYFSSFCVSQRDILDSAVRVTSTREDADWTVKQGSALAVRDAAKEAAARGDGLAAAQSLFTLMFSEGFGGDYSHKLIDYEQLGLEKEENLDGVMRELIAELGA